MLVNRPSAFIFQQIILPYIVSTSRSTTTTHQQRYFSSSSSATKPFEGQVERESRSTWEPYPASVSGSRQRVREYLGIGDDRPESSGSSSGSKGRRVEVDVDREEAYKRTAALAMERIIRSHQPLAGGMGSGVRVKTSYKGKGRAQLEDDRLSQFNEERLGNEVSRGIPEFTSHQDIQPRTEGEISQTKLTSKTKTISQISVEPVPTKRKRPFPPIIHQLLQARQFRLAVNHILNLSHYALDPILVENVAGFMERHGGGKAAERLRRGKIPTAEDKSTMTQDGEERLPDEYWSLVNSSRPPPRTLDDISTYMPGISLTPTQKFTAFCNLQLAHLLSTDSSRAVIPPKYVRKPNPSLRQLSDLLARIHHLENHRGFIPDRVTANIILSCWLRCSLAPSPSGYRLTYTKSGWKSSPKINSKAQGTFGKEQLGSLFDTISKLIDRSILSRDQSLSYQRHVQPFVRMLSKGFGEFGDGEGMEKVKEWDKVVKRVLLERQAGGVAQKNEILGEDK